MNKKYTFYSFCCFKLNIFKERNVKEIEIFLVVKIKFWNLILRVNKIFKQFT